MDTLRIEVKAIKDSHTHIILPITHPIPIPPSLVFNIFKDDNPLLIGPRGKEVSRTIVDVFMCFRRTKAG